MGHVREVVDGEDEDLGKPSCRLLMLLGVVLDLLQDLLVGVWRCDVAFDLGGLEASLVLQQVELLGTSPRIHLIDLLPLLEKHAVHADIGLDADCVVVDQMPLVGQLARTRSGRRDSQSRPWCAGLE